MPGKRQGDTHHALILRREKVKTLMLHDAKPEEISQELGVSRETIRKDMDAIYGEWRAVIQAKDLWNVKMSFDHKMELHRMLMMTYHQKPRQIPMGQRVVTEDRSFIKVTCVRELIRLTESLDKLAGLADVKPLPPGVGEADADEREAREMAAKLNSWPEGERKVAVKAILELAKSETGSRAS